jgi:putative tricarboxylic transport membrane protein
MTDARIRSALPYVLGLAVAGVLFFYAGRIDYTPREGALGPDFWPKLAIGIMAAVCLFEIARIALGRQTEAQGIAEVLDAAEPEEPAPAFPRLLLGGVALVLAYGFAVTWLGFILSTFLFLAAFMYLGRYRAHAVIWIASLVGTLALALVFLKVVYVSLPRGVPPFDRLTDWVTGLF